MAVVLKDLRTEMIILLQPLVCTEAEAKKVRIWGVWEGRTSQLPNLEVILYIVFSKHNSFSHVSLFSIHISSGAVELGLHCIAWFP